MQTMRSATPSSSSKSEDVTQIGDAGFGQFADQRMDASLRFYINSSREIIEEQDKRPRLQRAAQQDALLVAAGKTSYRLMQSVGSYAYLSHASSWRRGRAFPG